MPVGKKLCYDFLTIRPVTNNLTEEDGYETQITLIGFMLITAFS